MGTTSSAGSFVDFLKGVPAITAALTAAIAALLPLILPDGLVPEQLRRLEPIFRLTLLFALPLAWVFRDRLRRWLKTLVLGLGAIVLLLAAIHTALVVEVPYYGDPPESHRFLVGYQMTERGRALVQAVNAEDVVLAEQIRRIGDDQIPLLFGPSYWITSAVYVLATVGLAVVLVLTIGAIELDLRRRTT